MIKFLGKNQISNEVSRDGQVYIVHNKSRGIIYEESKRNKSNLSKIMSMYSNGKPMLSTITRIKSNLPSPKRKLISYDKSNETDLKNLPKIESNFSQNNYQDPHLDLNESFISKSTFNSGVHEHRKKIYII